MMTSFKSTSSSSFGGDPITSGTLPQVLLRLQNLCPLPPHSKRSNHPTPGHLHYPHQN